MIACVGKGRSGYTYPAARAIKDGVMHHQEHLKGIKFIKQP